MFGDLVLSTSSQGARGPREYAQPKPSGVQRILVFGDSFTFGEDVADDETYAHVREELLPATEVVNLGVHGYGHDQMLLYLREGARYEPTSYCSASWCSTRSATCSASTTCKAPLRARGRPAIRDFLLENTLLRAAAPPPTDGGRL